MTYTKRVWLALPVLVVAFTTLTATAAYAEDGSGNVGNGSSDSSTTADTQTGTSADSANNTTETSTDLHDGLKPRVEANDEITFRLRGRDMLQAAEMEHKSGKPREEITKVCEARKHGIETRTAALSDHAQKSLTRINTVFSAVVTFKTDNNLTVADFDALVASATAAQAQATASVQALAALNPTLDCASTSAANELASFKAALTQARTDLLAYRSTVVKLLVAIKQANDAGGQQ